MISHDFNQWGFRVQTENPDGKKGYAVQYPEKFKFCKAGNESEINFIWNERV